VAPKVEGDPAANRDSPGAASNGPACWSWPCSRWRRCRAAYSISTGAPSAGGALALVSWCSPSSAA